jgi:hypothetical protein
MRLGGFVTAQGACGFSGGSKTGGVVAVFIGGADQQQTKADDVAQAVGDLIRRARFTTQAARRSATRIRRSTSRNAGTPPSDDSKPSSSSTATDPPEIDDRPRSGSVGSFTAAVASLKSRESACTTNFYAKSET